MSYLLNPVLAVVAVVTLTNASAQAQINYQPYPIYPVATTPQYVTGMNPYTGGWNTGGTTVKNSTFDPFRAMSMNNGTIGAWNVGGRSGTTTGVSVVQGRAVG